MANKNNGLSLILARYALVVFFVLLLCSWIGFRLVDNTVLHAEEWNLKADSILNKTVPVYPVRGDILSCDGSVLATNVTTYTLRIDYRTDGFSMEKFNNALDSLCDSLAVHFPIRDRENWRSYLVEETKKEKSQRRQRLFLRDISYAQYKLVRTFPFFKIPNCNVTGLCKDTQTKRLYPYGEMARRSIGRTNHPEGRLVGFSGLEYALDSMLTGKPGLARRIPLTRNIVPFPETPPINGATVITTIDVEMQDIVENELNDMLRWSQAQWGTAILMDVATGDIKAISNLERSKHDTTYVESMNHAVARVEPGSVVKLVGMIIALEDGFAGNLERTIVTERGGFRYHGGKAIRDTHFAPSGSLPIYRLLQYSSNIGMTKLIAPHYENDPDAYRRRVEQLGLFDRFNTGIASEIPAYYPKLKKQSGAAIELSRMIYGYRTQIAPLYTCALYNAVANDGRFVRPRLVKGLRNSEGVDSMIPVSYVRDRICSEENARILRSMLRRVITEKGGTATGLKRDPEIVELAGKTGTAVIARERPRWTHEDSVAGRVVPFVPGYNEGHYRLAFVGFFPYDKPKYTCMVLIADPKPGIRSAQYTSGATVRAIAEKLHSRGLLDNHSDYREYVPEDRRKSPEVYATTSGDRIQQLGRDLGFKDYTNFAPPRRVKFGVPDVTGLGVREAVRILEEAGYPAAVRGQGYVSAQSPSAASTVPKGTAVTLILAE